MQLVSRLRKDEEGKLHPVRKKNKKGSNEFEFVSRNAASAYFGAPVEGDVQIAAEHSKLRVRQVITTPEGIEVYLAEPDNCQAESLESPAAAHRTCVLMNTSRIDEPWVRPVLKGRIHPDDRVCVLAFSFFDDTKNEADWNRQYRKGQGIWYRENTDVFFFYGLKESQIQWVNYFADSISEMKAAIMNSNILMLPGGAPDLMMKRIKEKKLTSLLKKYQGLVIGYSAGAMVQMDEYHITPDEDYPKFMYCRGLGYLSGFDIEAHYRATAHQKRYIERAIEEKGKEIYAIEEKGGMLVESDGTKRFFGSVHPFPATK